MPTTTHIRTRRRFHRGALFLLLALAFVLLLVGPAMAGGPAAADGCAGDGPAPYLHTCGTRIVDANGTPVALHAVNWYGFDSNDFVAGGLRYQSYQAIVDRIKGLGFNALRIPLSNEMIERNPVVSALGPICAHLSCLPSSGADALGPNSDLYGLDALTILKKVVDYAGSQGLYVILDDHRSEAAWGPQENGLWYTSVTCPSSAAPYSCYSAQSWLDDWQKLGAFFAGDPNVTGMDLRNEPHSAHQPSTCADYLASGHWGACGGANNNDTDWARAATAAGNALLSINPHWLIAVEGVSTYPQSNGGFPDDGWGENLQGAAVDPIVFGAPGGGDHLVYSPHNYRFSNSNNGVPPDAMRDAWLRNFGYLIATPTHPYSAPLWVGEFGTCTHANTCIVDTTPGSSSTWFSAFAQYLNYGDTASGVPGSTGWSYWPVNGTYSDSWSYAGNHWKTCYGQRENYGVLGGDWSTLAAPLMQSVLFPPSPTPSSPPGPPGPPGPPSTDTAPATTPSPQAGSPTTTATVAATVTATATATATMSLTVTATAIVSSTALPTTLAATPTVTRTPRAGVPTPTSAGLPIPTATVLASATPETSVRATQAPALQGAVSTPGGTATVAPTMSVTATGANAVSATATLTPTAAGATATTPPLAPAATATAPASATPPPTATPTATLAPSSTPLPTATAVPPPPTQWSTYSCAPYSITPTPSASATPGIRLTPLALLQPTTTVMPRPKPAATRRPAARHTQKKTVKRARPAPPLIGAHGSALRKTVRLDLELRHDTHGRLSGWLRYTDTRKGKRLDLRDGGWRTASTSCGALQSALVVGRLRDKKKVYDATLTLGIDKRHAARFALRLGRSYSLSAALTGSVVITCLPKPSPHKPSYKAPSHKPARKTPRQTTHHATTGHKPPAPKAQGRQAPPKGTAAKPPHR